MMTTLDLDEAQARLRELVDGMQLGEAMILTVNGHPMATLVKSGAEPPRLPRKAGSAKDTIHWMSPDFDAPLEEFEESMREKGK